MKENQNKPAKNGEKKKSGNGTGSRQSRSSGNATSGKGSTAKKSAPSKKTTSSQNKKSARNQKSGGSKNTHSGFSFGKFMAVLLALAFAAACIYGIVYVLSEKEEPAGEASQSASSLPRTSAETSAPLPNSSFVKESSVSDQNTQADSSPESGKNASSSMPSSSLPAHSEVSSPSRPISNSDVSVNTSPSSESLPASPSSANPPSSSGKQPDISSVMFKPTSENDLLTVSVNKGGKVAAVHYIYPLLSVPYDQTIEDTINKSIRQSFEDLLEKIQRNYVMNYDPDVHQNYYETLSVEAESISIYRGHRVVSIIVTYSAFTGKAAKHQCVAGFHYDVFTGEEVQISEILTDSDLAKEDVISKLDAERMNAIAVYGLPDPGNAWYLEEDTLTVIYDGMSVYPTDPYLVYLSIGKPLFKE